MKKNDTELAESLYTDKKGVAKMIGCSTRTIDNLMRTKKLPYVRLTPKLIRFKRADVIAHLEANFTIRALVEYRSNQKGAAA